MRIKKRMGMVMCSFVIAVTSVASYVSMPGVVTFAAEAISLNYSQLMLAIGESEELTLFGTEAVSFVSSKPSVAEVSGTGLITAKKQGTATVTAKGANGKNYKCTIYVADKETAERFVCVSSTSHSEYTDNRSFRNPKKTYRYDYLGRLIEETEDNLKNFVSSKKFTYYNNGSIKTESYSYCQTNEKGEQHISEDKHYYMQDGTEQRYESYSNGTLVEMKDSYTGAWYDFEVLGRMTKERVCDDNGMLISEIYQDEENGERYEFDYNSDGLVEESRHFLNNTLRSTTRNKYNSKKWLVYRKTTYLFKDGSGGVKEEKYDEKHNMILDCSTDSDGKKTGTVWKYEYDDKGRVISCIEYTLKNGKKVWNDSVTYKYDKRGNVIEQVVKEKNDIYKEMKYVSAYNKKDVLVKRKVYVDGILGTEYVWDNDGKELSEYTYRKSGELWYYSVSEYDEKGNLIKFNKGMADLSGKMTEEESTYENRYDNDGRLISKIRTHSIQGITDCEFMFYDNNGNLSSEKWFSGMSDTAYWWCYSVEYEYATLRELFTRRNE